MTDLGTTPGAPSNAKPPAGFYDDGSGRQRWFDGSEWTDHYQSAPSTPQAINVIVPSPAGDESRKARDKAVYTRQQKGHSLILNLLVIGPLTLWITTIYYTASPNHYWHA